MSTENPETAAPPETSNFKLNIEIDTDDGTDAVVVQFTYPKGRGSAALYAISKLEDYLTALADALVAQGDESVKQLLADAGAEIQHGEG